MLLAQWQRQCSWWTALPEKPMSLSTRWSQTAIPPDHGWIEHLACSSPNPCEAPRPHQPEGAGTGSHSARSRSIFAWLHSLVHSLPCVSWWLCEASNQCRQTKNPPIWQSGTRSCQFAALKLLIDFAVDLLGNCECVPELEVAPIREEHWNLHSKIFEYCVMMKEGLKCTSTFPRNGISNQECSEQTSLDKWNPMGTL